MTAGGKGEQTTVLPVTFTTALMGRSILLNPRLSSYKTSNTFVLDDTSSFGHWGAISRFLGGDRPSIDVGRGLITVWLQSDRVLC